MKSFIRLAKYFLSMLLFIAFTSCSHAPLSKKAAGELCNKQFSKVDHDPGTKYSLMVTDKPDPSKWTCFFIGFDIYSPNYQVIIEVSKKDGQIINIPGDKGEKN